MIKIMFDWHYSRLTLEPAFSGYVSTIAGRMSDIGGHRDGEGTNAWFNGPYGITVDDKGFLYVADSLNSVIRQISPSGTVAAT